MNIIKIDWRVHLTDQNEKLANKIVEEFRKTLNVSDNSEAFEVAWRRLKMVGVPLGTAYKILQTLVMEHVFEEGMRLANEDDPPNDH